MSTVFEWYENFSGTRMHAYRNDGRLLRGPRETPSGRNHYTSICGHDSIRGQDIYEYLQGQPKDQYPPKCKHCEKYVSRILGLK